LSVLRELAVLLPSYYKKLEKDALPVQRYFGHFEVSAFFYCVKKCFVEVEMGFYNRPSKFWLSAQRIGQSRESIEK
jgi:hypothetical protein